METPDVLVVGAGLAGLHTARLLAEQGFDVLVAERRRTLESGIRTTGIFVRRTLSEFALPPGLLGPAIRRVVLYPPSLRRPVELESSRDEFRVADMAGVYAWALARATLAGARVRLGVSYPVEGVRARFTIGADGARSTVARRLGLDVNRRFIVGAEEMYPVAGGDRAPTFHCVVDPRMAPGYLAWVVDDGRHAHVGLAGRPEWLVEPLPALLRSFGESFGMPPAAPDVTGGLGFGTEGVGAGTGRPSVPGGLGASGGPRVPGGLGALGAERGGLAAGSRAVRDGMGAVGGGSVRRRGGPIPVGGVLRRLACPEGLLVGDAAGAVSPLTAGGLDPCLRLSELAAAVTGDYLRSGDPGMLRHYDGAALRARFRGRLVLRRAWSGVRSRAVAEASFVLLRTPSGRAAAARLLFGDGSFPDAMPRRAGVSCTTR
ncbi:NAD(P)/FAD-dependent oxidoreductase [Actinoplanes sp. NPDC049681]|uniref:NAD(P)/FAD-dependent oxidoreductase n=1 Tax=Actinoplanes sp. NPDC049681 TaxID=3363905 RepID=UPI0037AA143E